MNVSKVIINRMGRDNKGNVNSAEATVYFAPGFFGVRNEPREAFSTGTCEFWYWLDSGMSIWQDEVRDRLIGALRVELYKEKQARKENA